MKESEIMKRIQLAASALGIRLWRNNSALGWAGESVKVTSTRIVELKPGDVVVKDARPLHAGLCVGSGDLIGIKPITITQDMVGTTIGQFVSCEVKSPGKKPTLEQVAFCVIVNKLGGAGFVVDSVEKASEELST